MENEFPTPSPQGIDPSSLHFTDKKGVEHTIPEEVAREWLETFNLKSLKEDFVPKLPEEVQKVVGKEVKLTKGSLCKLIERQREKYLREIKDVLENPELVVKHDKSVMFVKNLQDKTYFTSIGQDFDTHLTIVSNTPKRENILQNRIREGEILYSRSPKFGQLRYKQTFTDERSFANRDSLGMENYTTKPLKEDTPSPKS